MRLVFDASGRFTSRYSTVGATTDPAPPAPYVTRDFPAWPEYFCRGVWRAAVRGRVTLVGGTIYLDGAPAALPTLRTEATYGQAIAAIGKATSVAQLRQILYRVCDEFLGMGALDL